MSKSSSKLLRGILKLVVFIVVVGVIAVGLFEIGLENLSVTWLNSIFGVIMVVIAWPLMAVTAMANPVRRGGFKDELLAFLAWTYPLIYLVGLIGSISILYMDAFVLQQQLAVGFALLSGINVVVIVLAFGGVMLYEQYERKDRYPNTPDH